jgi:similar to stage IV sporulation protein
MTTVGNRNGRGSAVKTAHFRKWAGFVKIDVRGEQAERLLNALIAHRFDVWDIRRLDPNTVRMCVILRDFFRLRPLLRGTNCRVHVVGRYGFPFFLNKLVRRKMFLAGIFCFVVVLFALSSVVWRVDVKGNERIKTSDILQAAREEGVYRFQWKYRLKESDDLARRLQIRLPGTAWVGVHIEGTRVLIEVVETTRPEERELMSPRHLIAAKDAMITQIFAETGKPVVRPNMNVKKGDVLISGLIGDGASQQAVVAKGVVRGIVWEEAEVEIPLTLKRKVYTGETKTRSYLVIGDRGVQLTGYGKIPFAQYEIRSERSALQWRNHLLPFGWLKETVMEARLEEVALDPGEAERIALEQARAEVVVQAGPDAVLKGEKILLHGKTDSGKVYMKVLFEVEQNIAAEQPIVPPTPGAGGAATSYAQKE